ncbi:hypothetical protein, partial [Thermomonas sp.]
MKHVLIVATMLAGLSFTVTAQEHSRIRQGYAINPVRLNMAGKNPAKVGMGSYIVNAIGACSDCHTNPNFAAGGNPFLGQREKINVAGYLAGGNAFGPFISRNLTPNARGLPADLTLDQFLFVLNTGADVKGLAPFVPSVENDLLQVMPWPAHRNMT